MSYSPVAQFESIEEPAESNCRHCGLTTPEGRRDGFCCAGCASVFCLIREAGLEEFYRLRDNGGYFRLAAPAPGRKATHGYLDDPGFYDGAVPRELEFFLEGIHCSACVWLIEKLPEIEPSVEQVRVNLGRGVARVRVREGKGFSGAADALLALGYVPYPLKSSKDADAALKRENISWLKRIGVAGACAGNLMILSVSLYAGLKGEMAQAFRWISLFLAIPVLTYSAIPFYRGAMGALRARRLSIDVPLALAIAVGAAAGVYDVVSGTGEPYFDTLAMLVFLMLVSRFALRRIQQLMLSPSSALGFHQPLKARRVNADTGAFEDVYSHRLCAGDRIEVASGERLPADGVVASGVVHIDESLLTGESVPCRRRPGQAVYAGTLNLDTPLLMDVIAAGEGTRVGRMIKKVESNLAGRSPAAELADRLARVFVGAVIAGSALLFIGLTIAGVPDAGSRALALVIVTCPCALALATPLTLSLTLARAAKEGIWIRDAGAIEALAKVEEIFIDKTGTLTEGEYKVLDWSVIDDERSEEIASAVLGIELKSRHPVAFALVQELRSRGSVAAGNSDFEILPRGGVRALALGSSWVIAPADPLETDEETEPVTCIAVWRDGKCVARAKLGDRVRPEAAEVVRALTVRNFLCALLSGDGASPTFAVAKRLDIGMAYHSMTPEDKESVLRAAPGSAMVGDGANDAGALSAASVGIAVRGSMEASLRAAPVYLAAGISQLPRVLALARRGRSLLAFNAGISVGYNLIGATGAALGWVSPLTAAVLMPLSSLTVLVIAYVGVKLEAA